MSSYYDDEEMGPVMRERDEEALDWAITEREQAADMRLPGEAFCANCPDHEGCSQGIPCDVVQRVARATLVARSSGHNKTNDGRTNHE